MRKLFTVLCCCLVSLQLYAQGVNTDSLLKVLRSELGRAQVYDQQKEKRVAGLRSQSQLAAGSDFYTRSRFYEQLFEEYRAYKFDSAFVYVKAMADLAARFGKTQELTRSEIMMGSICLGSGFYKEAFDITNKIDPDTLPATQKTDYLILRARLNEGIADYDSDAYFSKQYLRQSKDDFQRLEHVTPSNDFEKTIDLAFIPDSVKARSLTPGYFYQLILGRNLDKHGMAMVATRLSFAYTGQDRIFFLALATLCDIRSSTKETLAVFLLGEELFKQNRTGDAYTFMEEAARNAKFYGARNRAVQIERMLPLIAGKVINEKQHERDKLLIGFLVFLIAAVTLFFALVIYRKQLLRIKANERVIKEKNAELENVNNKLWESSRIKEELIGLFFNTCSSYIETLDRLKITIQHNIKLGKYNEVNRLLNNVHIDKEKGQLYTMLDTVFLTIFPNFITAFNALLKKEDQVWPKSGETLNATLRIFALMRLGVSDIETVARILDYSVSTVYTYKARIKSRALVPANDFEQKIMEIKFIDSQEPVEEMVAT